VDKKRREICPFSLQGKWSKINKIGILLSFFDRKENQKEKSKRL
jgi:hypothetical protein